MWGKGHQKDRAPSAAAATLTGAHQSHPGEGQSEQADGGQTTEDITISAATRPGS